MINLQKIVAASKFVGFRNYTKSTQIFTTTGGNLASGAERTNTFTISLDNTSAVSRVRINYETLSTTNWYQLESYFSTYSWGITSGAGYDLFTFINYSGGNLVITVVEVNLTGGILSIPVQTINITARLFLTPFNFNE